MFEGDSADMCAGKFPLVSMGGRAKGLACADPGARTPIGASGNSLYFPIQWYQNIPINMVAKAFMTFLVRLYLFLFRKHRQTEILDLKALLSGHYLSPPAPLPQPGRSVPVQLYITAKIIVLCFSILL